MTQAYDLARFALTTSAYEALDAAASVDEVIRILAQAAATRAFARYTNNSHLEADAEKIRLYGEVCLYELRAKQEGKPK